MPNENCDCKKLSSSHQNIDIKKFLPHRDPILMVDKLLYLDDKNVKTSFKIRSNSVFLKNDLFSESGLIENIAQTSSIIVGSSYFNENDEKNTNVIGFINSIKSVRIFNLPKVGQELISTSKLLSKFDSDDFSLCNMEGEISCNGILLLNCRLNLLIKKVEK